MGRALRVGLSACFFHADPTRAIFKGKTLLYAEHGMVDFAMSRGALAVMIPPPGRYEGAATVGTEAMVEELDGLILQGGSDVAPESYGESPLDPAWGGDRVRDVYEIALIEAFMAQGKPILGVCRGLQILNVALGGTLYQDIAAQIPGARVHRDWSIYDENVHDIELSSGSSLEAIYGVGGGVVTSVHHQSVKDVAPGLVVEARSTEDGVIEALGRPRVAASDSWIVGVQWHPEFQQGRSAWLLDSRVLLGAFMEAVEARRALGGGV